SGALKQDLRYSPSKCFDTFPFPEGQWDRADGALAALGERYHAHRRALMRDLWLGLTDLYNLFHRRDLTPAQVARVSGKPGAEAEAGFAGILELRRLHAALDHAVLAAYGWPDLDPEHGFHELEYLAENDRVRHTISPEARKEVLRRLLSLNHARAARQTAAPAPAKAGKKRGRSPAPGGTPLFPVEEE
ncbi:MAG TPA: restriction endonuclease, partial [Candidatus Hydrogenedentes bacterium]|nr:restriction endonuclease [Candidatus Hydrogenedentota bacterium]